MRALQEIIDDLSFESLPAAWQDVDPSDFSRNKRLWDYQQEALQYALRALWKYYEDFRDYREGEPPEADEERKHKLWQWYRDNGLEESLDFRLEGLRRDIRRLLEGYYPAENGCIPYHHFINRMGFWMATGSGKSLVLIKLIQLLWHLMRRGEIPQCDILILTARDDLLEQLRTHIAEFNQGRTDFRIHLADLKAYPDVKRSSLPTVGEHEITVFFYRADNLSDEQKERIVDFHNYENRGHWYVLLDEAHKGDKEDSKRQHIYSVLSRHGFLFNFSATFTDPRDVLTTVYNFNLSEFVRAGYGKHICILRQENRAFRDREDYTGEEKQRIVLKTLLVLAWMRKAQESLLQGIPAYHRPLALVLVNSVNTRDADLKLFFRELERVGRGDVVTSVWEQARAELRQELAAGPEWLFEEKRFTPDLAMLDGITLEELRRLVFNALAPGEIEVLLRPSNRQEMAFKLKTAEQPFALIKIGDISGWLKEELEGYEVIEGYEDEGFFRRLNEEDSPINILMGSRAFYEGWDSNRPNVITYINIGTGTDAKKFILQSAGRGVRIEPVAGKRRRLLNLYNAGEIDQATFHPLGPAADLLETLFIFGTNRAALQTVIQQLDQEKRREAEHEIALDLNEEVATGRPLLIPVYREVGYTVIEARRPRKFEIAADELDLLQRYVGYLGDPRLLVVHHGATPAQIRQLQKCLANSSEYFNTHNGRRYGRIDLLLSRLFAYFQVVPQEVDGIKPLEGEIRHFRHIRVFLRDIRELEEKIRQVRAYRDLEAERDDLIEQFESRAIDRETFKRKYDEIRARPKEEIFEHQGTKLRIRYVARHYYVPVLLSETETIAFIRHIIRHPSEVRFLNALEKCVERSGNAFENLDWWAFSRIDEALDEVYIPYYDPNSNRVRQFKPDFVFWLQKGNRYAIVFVDPKGMQQTDYQYKVDGFRELFQREDGTPWVFEREGMRVQVHLLLCTEDANRAPRGYQEYWLDNPENIARVLDSSID